MQFGILAYGAGALAWAVAALLALTRWRRASAGTAIVPAALISALWAATISYLAAGHGLNLTVVFVAELIRDAVWLWFLAKLLPRDPTEKWTRWLPWVVAGVTAVIFLGGLVVGVLHDFDRTEATPAGFLIRGGLVIALFGLVLVEQTYRNSDHSERWALKFLLLAPGALFAYDLFLYSNAFLLGGVSGTLWEARGAANALIVPLLMVGLSRWENHRPATQISHHAAFYTTALLAMGGYLVAMAFAGVYVRIVGGSWGAALQVLFLSGALLILGILLFSSQARAWLRVFVAKNFAPYKYDYRAEWLRLNRTLSSPKDPAPIVERAVTALTQIVQSPAGGLWLLDEEGRYLPTAGDLSRGPGLRVASREDSWIRFLEQREWVLNLRSGPAADAPAGPPVAADAGRLVLPGWLTELKRAWLVVPLLRDNTLIGFVIISDTLGPGVDLTWEDLDLLKTAGRQVASFLELERTAAKLVESQQFDAYNRFAAFFAHDLKNVLAQQMLVVQNFPKHKHNPEFIEDAIATIDNSVRRLSWLLEQLRTGVETGPIRRIPLAELARLLAARTSDREPRPVLTVTDEQVSVALATDRLEHVLEHLVRNAQDAVTAPGRVEIRVRRENDHGVIEIEDNGSGMDEDFVRNRLFRPFDSTKGTKGMGIGAYQAREFIRSVRGSVEVSSQPGSGTRFVVRLPAAT